MDPTLGSTQPYGLLFCYEWRRSTVECGLRTGESQTVAAWSYASNGSPLRQLRFRMKEEPILHYLGTCPLLAVTRGELLGNYTFNNLEHVLTPTLSIVSDWGGLRIEPRQPVSHSVHHSLWISQLNSYNKLHLVKSLGFSCLSHILSLHGHIWQIA